MTGYGLPTLIHADRYRLLAITLIQLKKKKDYKDNLKFAQVTNVMCTLTEVLTALQDLDELSKRKVEILVHFEVLVISIHVSFLG